MELSESELCRIADFGRKAARMRTIEMIIKDAFQVLQQVGGVHRLRVVFSAGHGEWKEWRSSATTSPLKVRHKWPSPNRQGVTVFFDPDSEQSGYMTADASSAKAKLAMKILAPPAATAISLHAALERAQKSTLSETEIARETLRARDEERRRISLELHDDLGQSMASLKLGLKWAEDLARKEKYSAPLVSELAAARDGIGVMLSKIRDLSHTLYPRILDTLGLFAAVNELAAQAARHSKIKVSCQSRGRSRSLPKEVGVALYRCCQESINNALRHSGATHLTIELRYVSGEVRITVEDDGKGFNPRTLYDSSGRIMSYGFWTIRQRMADMNGAFRLSTGENQGTVVEMIVPDRNRQISGK